MTAIRTSIRMQPSAEDKTSCAELDDDLAASEAERPGKVDISVLIELNVFLCFSGTALKDCLTLYRKIRIGECTVFRDLRLYEGKGAQGKDSQNPDRDAQFSECESIILPMPVHWR